jgi:uncharacterized protein
MKSEHGATGSPDGILQYSAFRAGRCLATGGSAEVAVKAKEATAREEQNELLIFEDATGRTVEVDLRGSSADIRRRLAEREAPPAVESEPRGPGRPRLGVVAREVTLLPRHWEWLGQQPGGASVALRKLVEAARKQNADADQRRQTREAAYRAMSVLAGNEPGFEEAIRALFAGDRTRFRTHIRKWPKDVRAYAERMAGPSFAE